MKPAKPRNGRAFPEVAPHAGAWIETYFEEASIDETKVAPRAGAWIETYRRRCPRGGCSVAPRAGAWIETNSSHKFIRGAWFLPEDLREGLSEQIRAV